MPTRTASATWTGRLRDGSGRFEGESGVVAGDYSFGARFGQEAGTNPEELLAAAEAACFSMALSAALEREGTPAERVETSAACTVEKVGDSFRVTRIRLTVTARVPGADRDAFKDLAESTKSGCPISMALMGNVELEVDATLEASDGPMDDVAAGAGVDEARLTDALGEDVDDAPPARALEIDAGSEEAVRHG